MNTNEITTTDLSNFGFRELKMLELLLTAMRKQGLPQNFYNDEVTPMMNTQSGCVFLTNSEYQIAMLNKDKLEVWYSCSNCGHEGFKDDFEHEPVSSDCDEQMEWVKNEQ